MPAVSTADTEGEGIGLLDRVEVIAIDDDASIRWLLGEIMVLAGFKHSILASPVEGLREVDLHRPAVAVVDVNLAGVDGVEVARQIKRISPLTQILFLTGYGESVSRCLVGLLESAAVIEKPFDLNRFLDTINAHVSSRRAAAAQ
jgi:two-component system, NtrC family, C4-dicarboxylate transport response regulator DctD